MAGGSRADISSLMLWRPLSAIIFVMAVYINGSFLKAEMPALFWLAAGIFSLPLLQLSPLPPTIWASLPGQDIIVAVYQDVGIAAPWRPMAMVPEGAWNAFFAILAPLAAMCLTARLADRQHQRLLIMLLVVGFFSSLIGLLQVIGDANGPLYFYAITNFGEAVGLFANRNHHAVFLLCLLPMLSALYSVTPLRRELAMVWKVALFSAAAFVIPVLLATTSRAGLLLLPVAMLLAWWVYTPPSVVGRNVERTRNVVLPPLLGVAGLLAVSIGAWIAGSAGAVERLLRDDFASDRRAEALPTLWQMLWDHFPLGSGLGSFAELYKTVEPDALLSPAYFNHAHNDVLELVITAGLPGVALLGIALCMWGRGCWALWKSGTQSRSGGQSILGRCGASIILLLALASLADYPLRVPSLMVLAAIAAVWMNMSVHVLGHAHKSRSLN
jgi:O-antigen ligase